MKNTLDKKFWSVIKANWTLEERADLRSQVEAWMAADKGTK